MTVFQPAPNATDRLAKASRTSIDGSVRSKPIRVLLIGPMAEEIGGTTISFRHLIRELESRQDITFLAISTFGVRGARAFAPLRLARLLLQVACQSPRFDVLSLHASVTGIPYLICLLFVAKVVRKPLVFRLFGGIDYNALSGLNRRFARWFSRGSTLYLVQTQILLDSAKREGMSNARWFPTARPVLSSPNCRAGSRKRCRRFVFVGQLRIEKGLQILTQAAIGLPGDCAVDVYGPWYDLPKDTFANSQRVRYCGLLSPDEVLARIADYDVLVLPSFFPAEGYAGVILEAYSAGLPVIATRWKALPEIVLDGETGLLVGPKDSDSLRSAMLRLIRDDGLYGRLSQGAASFVKQFSTKKQAERFAEYCREALRNQKR